MYQPSYEAPEVNNLARSMEAIQGVVRGRGLINFNAFPNKCNCQRPYTHIICHNCGHIMYGRVRYQCIKHAMVTFLMDITNCPKCKSFEYMLTEFDVSTTL